MNVVASLRRSLSTLPVVLLLSVLFLSGCGSQPSPGSGSSPITAHLGYFPNLTHAIALVGVAQGTFQKALGPHVTLDAKTFSAGPTLIEALFANQIDIGYVGPNPAINGYVKSKGAALRVIAGASSGGVLFVTRPGAHIKSPADLANKKLADPQLGGTQDVSLRYYLQQHGLKPTDKGGNVQIVPTDPANILTLFKAGTIDGAWVPEPWATRLIVEGKGTVFLDERNLWPGGKFVTTNVVVRKQFLDQHPDLVQKFLQAHVSVVGFIANHPDQARTIINGELKRLTGKALPASEIALASANLDVTYDPLADSLLQSSNRAYALGFLGKSLPDLSGLYYLGPLNSVLTAQGLATVAGPSGK